MHRNACAEHERKAGSEHDEAAASGFRGYWRARISVSLARALGEQLLAGARILSAPFRVADGLCFA